MDSNAHTMLANYSKSNTRWKTLDDFILRNKLCIITKGNKNTFVGPRGNTKVDITLATPELADRLWNWAVNSELNHSDHRTITYDLKTVELKRDFNKLDLDLFRSKVEEKCTNWVIPPKWTLSEIETKQV